MRNQITGDKKLIEDNNLEDNNFRDNKFGENKDIDSWWDKFKPCRFKLNENNIIIYLKHNKVKIKSPTRSNSIKNVPNWLPTYK